MKKKYEVVWKEERAFKCSAEVEADSPEEAVKLAQLYEFDVDETELHTICILPGARVKEIEDA